MNCANLAETNGQQAPIELPPSRATHASRSVPDQTASIKRNRMVGHSSATKSATPATVKTESKTLPNSRWRSHSIRVPAVRGGGIAAIICRRTKLVDSDIVLLPLDQAQPRVVPIH